MTCSFSVKTGLVASCSSGSPTLRPSPPDVGAEDALLSTLGCAPDPASVEAPPAGTLEKADGAVEKALNADAPLPLFGAAANPLVEAKAENGDAEARLVVGAALVNGLAARSAAGAVSAAGLAA